MQPVQNAPTGTMNQDLDPRYLNKGKYRIAHNVRPITDGGGTTLDIEPVKGTRQEISIGAVSKQNKKYKVKSTGKAGEVGYKLYDEGGGLKTQDGPRGISNVLQYLKDKLGTVNDVNVNKSTGVIEFENGYDWTLELIIKVGDPVEDFYLFQEPLKTIEDTGSLHVIGKCEYHDKTYLFLTTCRNNDGGLGEIGVLEENRDGTLKYTRALRSKELNFSTWWPIDADAEENDFRSSLYWTDNVNVLRKFVHEGIGSDDFGLSFNGGKYDYGDIANQVKLIPAPVISTISPKGGRGKPLFGDAGQKQRGGDLKSGTYRYSVRFLTKELEESAWITMTNQIPVFKADATGAPVGILGSPPDTDTGKINVLEINNIDTARFSFIELAAVHYIGDTPTGTIVKRQSISGETMEIKHTGSEQNQRNLGNLANLINLQTGIRTAKNLSIIDNRMFISNVKFNINPIDSKLKAIADNIQVSWGTQTLAGLGDEFNKTGEYMLPWFCHDYLGYCSGETYRFGVRFVFFDGTFSEVYHVEDTGPPISGNITTSNNPRDVIVNFPTFTNIDLSSVSGEVKGVQAMRVEMTEDKREILTSGIGLRYIPSLELGAGNGNKGFKGNWNVSVFSSFVTSNHVFALISPDNIYNNFDFNYQGGDQVVGFFASAYNIRDVINNNSDQPQFIEYNGNKSGSIFQRNVKDVLLADRQFALFDIQTRVGKRQVVPTDSSGIIISLESDTPNFTVPVQAPVFFYKRPKSNKFGDIKNTSYIPCSQVVSLSDFSSVNNISFDFFGGDTFVQKTIQKVGLNLSSQEAVDFQNNNGVRFVGFTEDSTRVISFYSMNRVNSQLQHDVQGDGKGLYPQTVRSLNSFVTSGPPQSTEYDSANSFHNGIQAYAARNTDKEKVERSETRIYFSELNPTNSFTDKYGQFPPFNYKDVDPTYGPINHMVPLNGFLHHIQPRAFTREYVNAKGLIEPQDSTSVLLGSNEVLSKSNKIISNYGSNHKWSVIKGRSQGGDDIAYWYSSEFEKMLRFGRDGVVPISDVHGMQSWFPNNVKGAKTYDNPTELGGIHGVWDERFSELLMTFVVPKLGTIPEYNTSEVDAEGYITKNPATGNYGLDIPEGTIFKYDPGNGFRFYVTTTRISTTPLFNTKSGAVNSFFPESTKSYWDYVSQDNTDAYDFYTVVFNELKDGYTAFYDYIPRIYAPINNSIVSQSPSDQDIHLHNVGDYLVFYGKEYEGNIKMPINDDPNIPKVFQALAMKAEEKPFRVEFETSDHESYVTFFDFEDREGMWMAPVMLDSSLDGINDRESEVLRGDYLLVDLKYEPRQYQKLFNFVVRTVQSFRNAKA